MNAQVEYLNPETAFIRLSGRFDASTLDSPKQNFAEDEHLRYVIADMAQTTFMDSLGLAALVSTLKIMRSRGGEIFIVNPADMIRVLLEITHMNTVFPILPTVEEALLAASQMNAAPSVSALPPRLDAANAADFRADILAQIEKGTRRLILDATQTDFIDSSGLAILVSCYKAMLANGGRLVVAGLRAATREIFELTRMDSVFTLYPTVENARSALAR